MSKNQTELAARLMSAWDNMDVASQRVLVAQPAAMSEAAATLNAARLDMRAAVNNMALGLAKAGAS